MKKATLHKVTAIGMIAALTASQSAVVFAEEGDSSDKITLTFAFDEGVGTPTEEAIKAFNESQDEIEVQSYHLPQDANNLHDDFVNKMVAGDTSVDLMALDVVYIAEFASAGWIEALDDLYTEDELSAYLDGTVEGAKYDGKLYAAPWFTNASALFYRTDVLEDLGITEVPTTYQGWIDVYENVGKRSGAYSAGTRKHPYVLLNHNNDLNTEFTLAHEMGHALHSYLSTANQPVVDSDYVIFVAEVASTCNEALLMQHLLKKTSDKKQRAYLINYFLEQFRTTLYRQTMFAEFELKMSELTAKGESVNAETATKVYHDLIDLYFGPDIIHDEYIDLEWARIPHFYYNFYVYQYATGFSAAIALSQKILSEGEPAVKAYKEKFLSAGCSKDPVSILKDAGVDMSTKKPVEQALALFNSLLDEMDELMK